MLFTMEAQELPMHLYEPELPVPWLSLYLYPSYPGVCTRAPRVSVPELPGYLPKYGNNQVRSTGTPRVHTLYCNALNDVRCSADPQCTFNPR